MDTCGARKGWVALFDRCGGISWDDRIFWRTVELGGRTLHVVGG